MPETGSLNALRLEMLANNNYLKSIKSTIESTRKRADYNGSLPDPRLGFVLSNLPNSKLNFNQEPMTQKQIFIAQKFPWAGKLDLKRKGTLFQAEYLAYYLKSEELKLSQTLSELYYELGFLNESLQVNKDLTDLIDRIINVTKTRYVSGKGLQHEMFQAKIEESKIVEKNLILEKKISITKSRIHALLNNVEPVLTGQPQVPDLFEFTGYTDDLAELIINKNPELSALKTIIGKKRTAILLAKKESYPDIDLKVAYGQRDEDNAGKSRDDFLSFSATLNIPLWKSKRQNNSLLSGQADENAAVEKYKNLKSSLLNKAKAVSAEMTSSIRNYQLYKNKLIPQAGMWAKSALTDYEVGKAGFNSMINANIQTIKFNLKAKQYLFELYKKRAELEALAGGSLPDITLTDKTKAGQSHEK